MLPRGVCYLSDQAGCFAHPSCLQHPKVVHVQVHRQVIKCRGDTCRGAGRGHEGWSKPPVACAVGCLPSLFLRNNQSMHPMHPGHIPLRLSPCFRNRSAMLLLFMNSSCRLMAAFAWDPSIISPAQGAGYGSELRSILSPPSTFQAPTSDCISSSHHLPLTHLPVHPCLSRSSLVLHCDPSSTPNSTKYFVVVPMHWNAACMIPSSPTWLNTEASRAVPL